MPRANDEIAAAFEELADLLEIEGADRFRILSYRRAAATVSGLGRNIAALSKAELSSLRGVGKATVSKISEFLDKGTFAALEEARAAVPEGVRELTKISGLGPKKALVLSQELGIKTIDDLKRAAQNHKVREIKGLGPKTEENLLRALEARGSHERALLEPALVMAEEMLDELKNRTGIEMVSYAGSLRRMRETIGDVDLLVGAEDAGSVMEAFVTLGQVTRVAAKGSTKSSVITSKGMQVDLRVVKPHEFGSALQYFTGSKEHNVKVREIAVKAGYKLSEYGLFETVSGDRIAGEFEEDIYRTLGLDMPPPTMRENRGEVEMAMQGALPEVLELHQIKGDLHCHSTYSDGLTSIEDVVLEAVARGYSYIGISDHALKLTNVRHLTLDDIKRQSEEIAALNEKYGTRIRILHGVELNIGPSGGLDYSDDVLASFDYTIASVHQNLGMERDAMTRRVITALQHPEVNIFGHPTARRLNQRPPIELDLEAVFETASQNQVALEISGHGERLDLKDDHIHLARQFGGVFAVNTDSHSPERLWRMRLGVAMAQRGWTAANEVVNTRKMEDLLRFLAKKPASDA